MTTFKTTNLLIEQNEQKHEENNSTSFGFKIFNESKEVGELTFLFADRLYISYEAELPKTLACELVKWATKYAKCYYNSRIYAKNHFDIFKDCGYLSEGKELFYPLHVGIARAQIGQVETIMEIIGDAQRYLKKCKVDQWQDGFPTEDVIVDDIKTGEAYVFTDNNRIVAYVALELGFSDNYEHIFDGSWLTNNSRYATIHRTAISDEYRGMGLGSDMFDFCIKRALELGLNNIRIDTHENNKLMQHLISKYGFSYRGVIYLPKSGAKRLAYEIILEKK